MWKVEASLFVGLGDEHYLQKRIVNLKPSTWYCIALTWDKSDYVVYVDGVKKSSGIHSGLKALNPIAHIGNLGRGNSPEAFQGLIDEVTVFDRSLSQTEIEKLFNSGLSSIAEPFLSELIGVTWLTQSRIEDQNYPEAIKVLDNEIVKYKKWKQGKYSGQIPLRYELLSSELYFMLAKTKELMNLPKDNVVEAYKKAASRLLRGPSFASAFLWLYQNASKNEYTDTVRKFICNPHVQPRHFRHVAENFESAGNWSAFESFLDVLFIKVEKPTDYSVTLSKGLSDTWRQKFLEHLKEKPKLTECLIKQYSYEADNKIAQQDFVKAIKIYDRILDKCESAQKANYQLKKYECMLHTEEHDILISNLETLINNKTSLPEDLVAKAMAMKGRTYMQLGNLKKAMDTFSFVTTEYPASEQAPEALYFIGYCSMLQSEFDKAIEVFGKFIEVYPDSLYVSKAREHLKRMYDMID